MGPLLVGAAMQLQGPMGYFQALGALHFVFLAYVVWRKARKAPVPPEDKTPTPPPSGTVRRDATPLAASQS